MTTTPLRGNDADPVYRRIAADLREQIISHQLPPGGSLPTLESLARRYGVHPATIRRALAVLRGEGLIEGGAQGRAAIVSNAATIPEALPDYIAAAFRAEHVSIDVWALTAVELGEAMRSQIKVIKATGTGPETVAIRFLLPDTSGHHPLPRAVDDPTDVRPLLRLRNTIFLSAGELELSLVTELVQTGLVKSLTVEFRTLPTIPGEQRYIINNTQVLTGYYFVRRATMHHLPDGAPVDVLELHSDGRVFPDVPIAGAATPNEQARFEQVANWFETRWSELSQPLPLPD